MNDHSTPFVQRHIGAEIRTTGSGPAHILRQPQKVASLVAILQNSSPMVCRAPPVSVRQHRRVRRDWQGEHGVLTTAIGNTREE
jgi:hypothetical protein